MLAAAGVFVVYLLSLTRPGVFYSGDAGIKFVLVEQFAGGDLRADLRLPADPWVVELWDSGHYPFQPPFAYHVGDRYFAKDPVFFLLLTAPAYAMLGWRGLYVWPVVGLFATWLALFYVCRRNRLGPAWTAFALFVLAFASPLTLYAAMFWEHTVSVALAFWGLAVLMAPLLRSPFWNAGLAGLLLGSAVWFRMEHAWLCLVSVALLPMTPGLGQRRGRWSMAIGVGLAAVGLLAWNATIYGEPLGIQARQIVEESGVRSRLQNYLSVTPRLLSSLASSGTPMLAGAMTTMFLMRGRDAAVRRHVLYWSLLVLAFVLGLGIIAPPLETGGDGGKQFGPRFLLLVYPVVSLLLACSTRSLWVSATAGWRLALCVVLALGCGLGVNRNAVQGALHLADDYAHRVAPVLDAVRSDQAGSVVLADQFGAQELSSLLGTRQLLFFEDHDALLRLARSLPRQDQARFYVVTFENSLEGDYPVGDVGSSLQLRLRTLLCTWQFCLHYASVEPTGLLRP